MEKSDIYLQRSGTREDVDAELWDDISDLHLELWRSTWVPMIDHAKRRLKSAAVPPHKWPQDLHWDWGEKTDWSRPLLTLQRFSITCGGALQGLMLVNLTKLTARLPSQKGKDLAYIEFVSTAPWNRPEISGVQQFHGIGIKAWLCQREMQEVNRLIPVFREELCRNADAIGRGIKAEVCGKRIAGGGKALGIQIARAFFDQPDAKTNR